MLKFCAANNWVVNCCIFDEIILSSPDQPFVISDAFEELQEKSVVKYRVSCATSAKPLLSELLLAHGRAVRREELPPPLAPDVGGACLYHAVQYLDVAPNQAWPPCDGPHSVRSFNERWGHDSQREQSVLLLQECGMAPNDVFRVHSEVVCWQPHAEGCGHFAALKMSGGCVDIYDAAIGSIVRAPLHHFVSAALRFENVYFYYAKWYDVSDLPTMDGAAYEVEGSGRGRSTCCMQKAGQGGPMKRIAKRPASCFPAPKRGKRRMYARPEKLDKKKLSALWKKTPYVRYGIKSHVKRKMQKWAMSIEKLDSLTELQVVHELTNAGFLKDWTQHFCPFCGAYNIGKLRRRKDSGSLSYRCNDKGCQKHILPHANHMVFTTGWGRDYKSLVSRITGKTTIGNHCWLDDSAVPFIVGS